MQRKIAMCCLFIHNFIRVNQGYEDEYDAVKDEVDDSFDPHSVDVDESDNATAAARKAEYGFNLKRELLWHASLQPTV